VVGPGVRFRHKYEKYVRNHGIKDVVFVGMASYNELPRYYQTADIFCSPATGRESFGIVLLEAMALGKPVIASNIEGYASVMTSGKEGLLVPPKNDQALLRALSSLITDESLRQRMGQRGLETAREHDWAKVARRVNDYYVKMLNQPALRRQKLEYEAIPASV
jgi:phosphatidylinositol alpha-mannosyltransferase